MARSPYVSYDDVRAVCPFIDQLQVGTDQFLLQRMAARDWLDSAITTAYGSPRWGSVAVCSRVIRACAYRAASEILAAQITPIQSDNAYATMAGKFQRVAEAEISTLTVRTRDHNDSCATIDLSVKKRGYHG
jgi:hypothetical protein